MSSMGRSSAPSPVQRAELLTGQLTFPAATRTEVYQISLTVNDAKEAGGCLVSLCDNDFTKIYEAGVPPGNRLVIYLRDGRASYKITSNNGFSSYFLLVGSKQGRTKEDLITGEPAGLHSAI